MNDDDTDPAAGPTDPTPTAPAGGAPAPPPPPPPMPIPGEAPVVGSSAPPPPPPPPPVPGAPGAPGVPVSPEAWPGSPLPAPPPTTTVVATRWRSLRGLTTALTVFLWLAAAASLFAVVAFAARISSLSDIIDHGITLDRMQSTNDADDLVGAAVAILFLVMFVVLVLIIIWTFRAAKNNDALGRVYPRLKPGWAIAGWLIPFVNLVIPLLMLQDLWRGSEARTPRGDPSWRSNRGSALIGWYWGVFVLSSIRYGLGRSSAHFIDRDELRELRTHDSIAIVGMLATIAAAVLAIQVVRKIAARQEECLRVQQAAWSTQHP